MLFRSWTIFQFVVIGLPEEHMNIYEVIKRTLNAARCGWNLCIFYSVSIHKQVHILDCGPCVLSRRPIALTLDPTIQTTQDGNNLKKKQKKRIGSQREIRRYTSACEFGRSDTFTMKADSGSNNTWKQQGTGTPAEPYRRATTVLVSDC